MPILAHSNFRNSVRGASVVQLPNFCKIGSLNIHMSVHGLGSEEKVVVSLILCALFSRLIIQVKL